MTVPVRVVLVDDDPLVRTGLRYLLEGSREIAIVGEAGDGDEVPAAVRVAQPDVVLMDLRMPRIDGVRATADLTREPGAPAVVVLTTFDTDTEVVGALRAGAAGYLLKDTPPADLVAAVVRAAAGDSVLSPAVTRRVMRLLAHHDVTGHDEARRRRERLARLTDGERTVAEAVADGLANAEIAERLRLSTATVKAYVSRALTKLDLSNRVQLALLIAGAEQDAPRHRAT